MTPFPAPREPLAPTTERTHDEHTHTDHRAVVLAPVSDFPLAHLVCALSFPPPAHTHTHHHPLPPISFCLTVFTPSFLPCTRNPIPLFLPHTNPPPALCFSSPLPFLPPPHPPVVHVILSTLPSLIPKELCPDDASRGKIAGFKQAGSLSGQLLFAGLVFGISKIAGVDDIGVAIMGNTMCFLWICAFVPLAARVLIERPTAQATNGKSLCVEAFGQLAKTFKEAKRYPQTFKYLIMHVFASGYVGTVVSQLPTYGATQLGLDGISVLVLLVAILVSAVPAALVYSFCCAPKIGVKLNQIFVYVYVRRAKRN